MLKMGFTPVFGRGVGHDLPKEISRKHQSLSSTRKLRCYHQQNRSPKTAYTVTMVLQRDVELEHLKGIKPRSNTHVKISQLVNKMCSQQAFVASLSTSCNNVVIVATRLSLTTC
jgi:hypothetical protein